MDIINKMMTSTSLLAREPLGSRTIVCWNKVPYDRVRVIVVHVFSLEGVGPLNLSTESWEFD